MYRTWYLFKYYSRTESIIMIYTCISTQSLTGSMFEYSGSAMNKPTSFFDKLEHRIGLREFAKFKHVNHAMQAFC